MLIYKQFSVLSESKPVLSVYQRKLTYSSAQYDPRTRFNIKPQNYTSIPPKKEILDTTDNPSFERYF